MKKILLSIVATLLVTSTFAESFDQSAVQVSGGYLNIGLNQKFEGHKRSINGFNGLAFSIAKQYGLVGSLSASTGLDLSATMKHIDGENNHIRTFGINQTLYYNIDQGNFVLRPLVELGLGSRNIGADVSFGKTTVELNNSAFYYKYNLGAEVVFNNGFGAQLKYGQQFAKHTFKKGTFGNPEDIKIDHTDNALTLSALYRF